VATVVARLADAGLEPRRVDLTIVGARPKLASHLDAMRAAIAALLADRSGRGEREGVDRQPGR
jgi:2C-methyl-D-erythritol 2,4-cyclodiphosphate synthase